MSSSIVALSATKVATIFAQGYTHESDEAKAEWIMDFTRAYASSVGYMPDDCRGEFAAYYASKGTKVVKKGGG